MPKTSMCYQIQNYLWRSNRSKILNIIHSYIPDPPKMFYSIKKTVVGWIPMSNEELSHNKKTINLLQYSIMLFGAFGEIVLVGESHSKEREVCRIRLFKNFRS